jgi:tRNA uridine 5-carboxymethylaminomethyl modification enzyme
MPRALPYLSVMSRTASPHTAAVEAEFDVIVVGGGHAGTEAAVAAARLGARVALVTSALETIGQMSCNPAIGGVAKGTVVREVDALGGIMGRATDLATLQFRMLNRGKGPAVWAPRAQCDRGLYRRAVRALLERHTTLHTIQGTVARLLLSDAERRVVGLETVEGRRFGARAVVLTTGTFGRGRIHIGTDTQVAGGRAGEPPATHLAEQLERLGLEVSRFKTGTPPRIDGRSVDLAALEPQESEIEQFDYRWSHFWPRPGDDAATRGRTDDAEQGEAPAVATRGGPPPSSESSPQGSPSRHHPSPRRTGPLHPLQPPPLRLARPPQLPCWITFLGEAGKRIIADNIGRSAMYGGAISSRGPRYCPSVEDKIVRFPEAARHQLFLEPEGLDTTELYVNGLSTSLPAPVQLEILRSVPGLADVRMTRAGYAIEYDYYPPSQLDATLQVRALRGLFFAGQINGTTGYEEAAGQGTVAGLNAGLAALERPPLILGRETSYIGVLIDDIVTRGVDEPYRLFTSRSEFRLSVRQDNALPRLAGIGVELGIYSDSERSVIRQHGDAVGRTLELARATSLTPESINPLLSAAGSAPLQHAVKVIDLARRQHVSLHDLLAAANVGHDLPVDAVTSAELEIKYEGYLARERTHADKLRRLGDFRLAADLPYDTMRSLSFEARQKLAALAPATLAQASRIPGVSPADLQNLVIEIEKLRREPAID